MFCLLSFYNYIYVYVQLNVALSKKKILHHAYTGMNCSIQKSEESDVLCQQQFF